MGLSQSYEVIAPAMLTIRKEQMAVLASIMAERFRVKLMKRLRAELPAETKPLSDQHLRGMIDEGMVRARRYDVTTERDITLFVFLMVTHSPRFEEASAMAWARKILLNKELDGEAKMSLIYQVLAAREQQRAKT